MDERRIRVKTTSLGEQNEPPTEGANTRNPYIYQRFFHTSTIEKTTYRQNAFYQ